MKRATCRQWVFLRGPWRDSKSTAGHGFDNALNTQAIEDAPGQDEIGFYSANDLGFQYRVALVSDECQHLVRQVDGGLIGYALMNAVLGEYPGAFVGVDVYLGNRSII